MFEALFALAFSKAVTCALDCVFFVRRARTAGAWGGTGSGSVLPLALDVLALPVNLEFSQSPYLSPAPRARHHHPTFPCGTDKENNTIN